MAQRRIDRFAQMSKQEELIAKKRLEILEKQRTTELAKAVQAAQNFAASGSDVKIKKEPSVTNSLKPLSSLTGITGKISFGIKRSHPSVVMEQPAAKVQNSFCNDGSFLENFKKILEKHESPKPNVVELVAAAVAANNLATEELLETKLQPTDGTSASLSPPTPPQFSFGASNLLLPVAAGNSFGNNSHHQPAAQPPILPAAFFTGAPQQLVPPPPPPTTIIHSGPPLVAPPPPPPPQLPIALANLPPLYMIPAPDSLQLNAIPAPKDFDLNAIPKPQLNLEAIQIPLKEEADEADLHEKKLVQQSMGCRDRNEHKCKQFLQVPTTIDNLIDMVAENGDEYEDKIRTHRNQLHPAMWFLFDKNSEQYHAYRQALSHCVQQGKQQQSPSIRDGSVKKEEEKPDSSNDGNGSSSGSNLNTSSHSANSNKSLTQHQDPMDKYDPESVIDSGDIDSDDEWLRGRMDRNRDNIRRRIECRNELSEEEREERQAEAAAEQAEQQQLEKLEKRRRLEKRQQRKSRWGGKVEHLDTSKAEFAVGVSSGSFANQHKPVLSSITRNDAALLHYARLNYGSINLSEEDWKKCVEHYKINLLYQDMLHKRQELDRLARGGKFKYEYDSDEDIEGGTWEHKLRSAEMEATQAWASALTKQSEGKHHIGDFLPPEELKKFMEQYEAKKNNRQPDLSDYKEYKLKEDNIGFQMLQKLGWKEGQGLGTDGGGIVDPVNKGPSRDGNQGLGIVSAGTLEECDNEYDAYRKRMMLAYRFRPNPLNNPRRAYY